MISVIVPVYKVEKYLEKCVNSIRSQSYSDLEIILVDDGSPDNCGKICDEMALNDQRIRVIHQKNQGSAAARNAGLAIAQGKYVAFVDSDDTIENGAYLMLHNMIEHYDTDIAICECRKVKENELVKQVEYSKYENRVLDNNKLWELVFGQLNNSSCNKLYKRNLLNDLQFPEKVVHGEDLLFNIEYLVKCNTGVYNEAPVYNYLSRNDSATRSSFNENVFWEIIAKDKAKDLVKQYMPIQLKNAELFCFRARMNVLRSVFASDKEEKYKSNVTEWKSYVKCHYKKVRVKLKFKEEVEYFLLFYFNRLYRRLIKCYE